jgi:hypothetical protein
MSETLPRAADGCEFCGYVAARSQREAVAGRSLGSSLVARVQALRALVSKAQRWKY